MDTYNPVSTYRLQFNSEFRFSDAEAIIPYLDKLGVKTIYASPVFAAVKGSNHGYDVTNPHRINPELGTADDFYILTDKVHEHGMGWIQDIVPNHMAYSTENQWICDVLEKGHLSPYYSYFDIIDDHPDPQLHNKLILPFFGKPLNEMLDSNELSVVYRKDGFKVKYFETEYPVSVPAYAVVVNAFGKTPVPEPLTGFMDAETAANRFDETKQLLAQAVEQSAELSSYVNDGLTALNKSRALLEDVVDKLYYFPAFWRDTETRINYRRFFTINGLICLNIQNDQVFQ